MLIAAPKIGEVNGLDFQPVNTELDFHVSDYFLECYPPLLGIPLSAILRPILGRVISASVPTSGHVFDNSIKKVLE